MKIIYLANIRVPTEKAHGIQIMKMCEAFARAGAEVELVVPNRRNLLQEDPFSYYGVERILHIKKLSCPDFVRYGRLGFLLSTILFLRTARRYLRARLGEPVYTREPLAPLFFSSAAVELHTFSNSRFVRFVQNRARHIIAITQGLKQDLVASGAHASSITVLPDGVDLREFEVTSSREEAREKLGFSPHEKVALYAGSFSTYAWKGVDVFLNAAKLLPDVLFVGVGGTTEEASALVGALAQNTRCISRKPHTEIPLYLRAADVLVLPNKQGDRMSERYTSPLKLFEYMASGTPILASNLPSIREILDEKLGYFFSSGDSPALAEGISAVLRDPEAPHRASAAKECAKAYTWDARARRIISLLSS